MKYQIYISIELDEVYEAETKEKAIEKAIEYTKKYGEIFIEDIDILMDERKEKEK